MEEKIIDIRQPNKERTADGMKTARLVFKLNHTMPRGMDWGRKHYPTGCHYRR